VAAARPAPGDNGRVPSAPPPGDPAPPTGELPAAALAGLGERPFGFYVHVAVCVTRCGYCDFNTYTDLGGMQSSYAAVVVREIELARRVLGDADVPVSTVFVGGGTPTLLPAGDLATILGAIERCFGLAPGAEVTTEANPETGRPPLPRRAARGGLHPAELWDAERRPARPRDTRAGAPAGPSRAVRRLGEGGWVRAGEP
jgi:oxygen-independent coproporphyrinogen-3 oxidase